MSWHHGKTVEDALGKATRRKSKGKTAYQKRRCEGLIRRFQNERQDFEIILNHFSDLSRQINRLSRRNDDELNDLFRNALQSFAGSTVLALTRIRRVKNSTSITVDGRAPNLAEWVPIIAVLEGVTSAKRNLDNFSDQHSEIRSLVNTTDRLAVQLNGILKNMISLIREMMQEGCFAQ